jgi:predicted SpoU family rRNA methylase
MLPSNVSMVYVAEQFIGSSENVSIMLGFSVYKTNSPASVNTALVVIVIGVENIGVSYYGVSDYSVPVVNFTTYVLSSVVPS